MLNPGDKVKLCYYEGEGQIESFNWVVKTYDNGLLKVYRASENFRVIQNGKVISNFKGKAESVIFNLRSLGFLKAELIE